MAIEEEIAQAREILRAAPRFWSRVDVRSNSECWPWTGPTSGFGHGRYRTPAGSTAHRFAWACRNGELPPKDLIVRHRCDNPPCCNPAHLVLGTQKQNVADMIERGRAPYSDEFCRNGHARTPENTRLMSNGFRRCKVCQKLSEANTRATEATFPCPRCDKKMTVANTQRHLRRLHHEEWSAADIRRHRAARIEQKQ